MMQGDSYGLRIDILKADGTAVTADDVADVEITVGDLIKKYSDKKVTFDADGNKWIFPLSQEETFSFPASRIKAQVRVVWASGAVEGASLGHINVFESISREVL